MRFKHIWTVWRKELLDTVRDRRSLVMILVVPLVVMPLFVLGPSYLRFQQEAEIAKEFQPGAGGQADRPEIVVHNGADAPELVSWLSQTFRLVLVENAEAALQEGQVLLIVTVPEGFEARLAQSEQASITVRFNPTQTRSRIARDVLEELLEGYRHQIITKRLEAHGISSNILQPFLVDYHSVATKEQLGGFILSFILPLFLVMWAAIGGSQTAIDITVGEKERKTLEMLLVTPIRRESVVLGKVLAIFTVTFIAALVSVLGFVLSLRVGAVLLGGGELRNFPLAELSLSFSPTAALVMLGLMAGIAAMMSALTFALFSWTRSIREAQSHTTWITFGVMIPAFVVQFREVTPNLESLLIPIFNATVVFKELLLGKLNWANIGVTLASSLVYALIAVMIAMRVFRNERVIFRQ